ncbi:acyl carrier protein [Maridesulfovibrio hydrothermalis]|uniref:Putative Acyl carrier protein n=1 Tax=Maridesulfovibrio hydrothermalis AM13 = DSM 14728 TaxID=1121451 RepID=L0RAH6_9BACT|nr:acyl carrier protein [Maridesulfovibrio hydrothermalis]CCO23217.1 putative Acyl carrier protein [Maridesulfovibrio hydrothermalis AM13 = DSM 14728]
MKDIIIDTLGKYISLDSSFDTSTQFVNIDGWDSLKHVQFILDLEKELDIKLTPEQLIACTSVDVIIQVVDK